MPPEQISARVSQEITDEVKMHIAAGLDADTLRDLLADKEVPYDDNESDEKEIARLTAEVARINAENRRLTDEALTDIESLEAAERERDEARAEVADMRRLLDNERRLCGMRTDEANSIRQRHAALVEAARDVMTPSAEWGRTEMDAANTRLRALLEKETPNG